MTAEERDQRIEELIEEYGIPVYPITAERTKNQYRKFANEIKKLYESEK